MLPGHISAFRAGFWPDGYRESAEIGPPAGLRPGSSPVKIRHGKPVYGPEALLRNIKCNFGLEVPRFADPFHGRRQVTHFHVAEFWLG